MNLQQVKDFLNSVKVGGATNWFCYYIAHNDIIDI